ncbi:unnamed protein product [Linum trigynum]|uniref:Uncharacterized protein n=1 Tax=Linum trigynum TaxID=586398 RepID=A0AAV2CRP6_9ROSI
MAIDSGEAILSFLPVPDELADRWYFRIFDSFKDLVLCGFQETPRIHSEFSRSLFVCNPFTKQWVALPLAPEIASSSRIGSFVARLVCEPLTCSSNVELDLGEGRPPLVYCSAYRFRVLCIYQMMKSTRVDVFCSESGECTKEALVLDEHYQLLACNGISLEVAIGSDSWVRGSDSWIRGSDPNGFMDSWIESNGFVDSWIGSNGSVDPQQ